MASPVILKRSAVASKVPLTTDLALGEIAINTYDGKLFIKKDNGTASIVEIGAGGGGGGATNLSLSANSSTITVLSDTGTDAVVHAANSTTAGVLTAETQTISGIKTFNANTIFSGGVSANGSFGSLGQVLTSNGSAVYWSSVSGGASAFTGLSDVPTSYAGKANYIVTVNSSETGLAFSNNIAFDYLSFSSQASPSTPSADTSKMYMTSSGSSPNREVALKMKNELGDEIIISSVLV